MFLLWIKLDGFDLWTALVMTLTNFFYTRRFQDYHMLTFAPEVWFNFVEIFFVRFFPGHEIVEVLFEV